MTNFRNVTTPWGRSQGGSLLAPGITMYHTASHGGVKVIKSQNLQIPAAFRNEDGWYEEDCESLIPFYFRFEQILEHCLQQGLDGWTISAEEYFAKYTKAYFREQVRVSFPVAYAYHCGETYSDEELTKLRLTRDELTVGLDRIHRKVTTPIPKRGDRITFDTPIQFVSGWSESEFTFEARNAFRTRSGMLVKIRNWKERSFHVDADSVSPGKTNITNRSTSA